MNPAENALVQALKILKGRVATFTNDTNAGICMQLRKINEERNIRLLSREKPCSNVVVEELFIETARNWPQHSGNYYYPIPATAEFVLHPSNAGITDRRVLASYCYAYCPLWEGKSLELRMSLIDFIIETLEAPKPVGDSPTQ